MNKRTVLLYQGIDYIATLTLCTFDSISGHEANAISPTNEIACVVFRDPYFVNILENLTYRRDNVSSSVAIPYISIINLITHQNKNLHQLKQIHPDEDAPLLLSQLLDDSSTDESEETSRLEEPEEEFNEARLQGWTVIDPDNQASATVNTVAPNGYDMVSFGNIPRRRKGTPNVRREDLQAEVRASYKESG